MAVENADDLAIFFDADDFGVVATITPSGGSAFDVPGLFDEPSLERGVQQDNQYRSSAQVVGQNPVFRAPTADLANAKAGAALTVNGRSFVVFSAKPDGLGTTRLELKKA